MWRDADEPTEGERKAMYNVEDGLGEWRVKAYPTSLYGVYKAQFDTYIVVMPVKENNVLILKAGERLMNGEINE